MKDASMSGSTTRKEQSPRSGGHASPSATGYTTGRRMSSLRVHLSFMGCVHSEIVKLVSLVSTWWLMGISLVLIPAMSALGIWSVILVSSTNMHTGGKLAKPRPLAVSDLWLQIGSSIGIAALVIGIFGVMSVTSEYTTSAIQSSLVANPRRVMFMNSKAVATAVFTFVVSLAGMLVSWLVYEGMTYGRTVTPLSHSHAAVPYLVIFGAPVSLALVSVMSLGLGAICRSTAGGVFSVVGLLILLPSVLGIVSVVGKSMGWLSSIGECLPDSAIGNFLSGGIADSQSSGASSGYFSPNWWQSGIILCAWAVVFYAVGTVVLKHSDVK